MMGEQANDDAGAKAYIRKTIDDLSKDRYSLIEAATYLAADPSIKKRDLDAAKYAAEKLKAISGSSEDPDSLAALGEVKIGWTFNHFFWGDREESRLALNSRAASAVRCMASTK
jgi:hypothetical protein